MSKIGLTEIQQKKMAKLLDATYPQGDIIKVDTSALPPELDKAVKKVQDKVEELRESIIQAEDILKEIDVF